MSHGGRHLSLVVPGDADGARLDVWLASVAGLTSRAMAQRLIEAARSAGAGGAKLSGGGRGGNIIALVDDSTRESVAHALDSAGAKRVILTEIK